MKPFIIPVRYTNPRLLYFTLLTYKRLCIFGPKGAIQIRYYYYYYYYYSKVYYYYYYYYYYDLQRSLKIIGNVILR